MRDYFMETARVGFSIWTKEDLWLAKQLWGEKDVTRYLCAEGKFSSENIKERLRTEINNYSTYHVQYWPIFDIRTSALIGCCGLRPFQVDQQTYELGFHLKKEYWGQGYAFEAAEQVIKYAFTQLEIEKLAAGHHPKNIGSQKLLKRLGFTYTGDCFYKPTGLCHPSYVMDLE